MSDDLDRATRAQDIILSSLISHRVDIPRITHIGVCNYCGEVVESPKLFCNGDCADDFEKYGKSY